MRITAALVVAVIGCGTASMALADTAVPRPRTTATPSGASATPVKHSLKACNKQADARKLTGRERSTFVKNCRGAKGAAPP